MREEWMEKVNTLFISCQLYEYCHHHYCHLNVIMKGGRYTDPTRCDEQTRHELPRHRGIQGYRTTFVTL